MNHELPVEGANHHIRTLSPFLQEITGTIAERRCFGKHLSFVTLLLSKKNDADEEESPSSVVKVVFRRTNFFAEATGRESRDFPVKNSDLPFGAFVSMNVVSVDRPSDSYEVRSWRLIGEHPREQAQKLAATKDGVGNAISCSKYLQAREEDFLKIQRQLKHGMQRQCTFRVKPKCFVTNEAGESAAAPHHGSGARRAQVFADWLRHNLLSQHSHPRILDVAGGKGQLSVALAAHATCTVVDPLQRSRRSRRQLQKSRAAHATDSLPAFVVSYFAENQATDNLVSRYDMLVGLHPDECTEAILDMALKHDKPFAIVPCCVFPSLFMRELYNGKRVQSYDDFLLYLKEKDPRIQQAALDMPGRNQVIFLPPALSHRQA